jgi:hypothetical protein
MASNFMVDKGIIVYSKTMIPTCASTATLKGARQAGFMCGFQTVIDDYFIWTQVHSSTM